MIARTWRGVTRAEDAEAYLAYMKETGLEAFRETAGNRGAAYLRRIVGDRAEFIVVSLWESREAIGAFAGEEVERAVFYPEDDAYLIERDLSVGHYDVIHSESRRPDGETG